MQASLLRLELNTNKCIYCLSAAYFPMILFFFINTMMIIAIIVHNAKTINENVTERPIIVLFPERTLLKAFEVAILLKINLF